MAFVDRHFTKFVITLLAAFGGLGVLTALGRWRKLSGAEPEWIAQALASGHGYSFDGSHRWLLSRDSPDQYFTTAWSDPVFPLLYAALISVFGEWSRLIMVLLLLACFLVTAALVALTARRLAGPVAGLLALLVLIVEVRGGTVMINASLLAGLWVALLLLLLVAHIGRFSLRISIVLGAVLGISVLTWSSTMVFIPVVVLLLFSFAPAPWFALKMSAAMALTAILLVAPWTARNYVVFDEFVPVRTGLGHLAQIATIGLTNTFAPERTMTSMPAPFRSSGPFDAVAGQIGGESNNRRVLLMEWQWYDMMAQLGEAHDGLNEAQLDKLLLRESRDFIIANPLIAAQLAVAKLWEFLWLGRWPDSWPIVAALTVFGLVTSMVLAFRDLRLLIPLMLALAYMAPFVIIVPLYYRYRYPIEPVIAVLVGVSLAHVAAAVLRSVLSLQGHRWDAPATAPPGAAPGPPASIQRAQRTRQSHAAS
jgi:hypothetical protein